MPGIVRPTARTVANVMTWRPDYTPHMRRVVVVIIALALFSAGTRAQRPAPSPSFKVASGLAEGHAEQWIFGALTGVFVDKQDHVWVTHLPETLTEEELGGAEAADSAPAARRRRQSSNSTRPGTSCRAGAHPPDRTISIYPRNPHGIFVDHNDFVWVGTYMHHRVKKFTREGKLLMTIGIYDKNAGSNDTTLLGGPAGIWVDPATNEVFIADGYRNRRVIVFDGATGKYMRHWGAYGEKPDDTEKFDPKTMADGA